MLCVCSSICCFQKKHLTAIISDRPVYVHQDVALVRYLHHITTHAIFTYFIYLVTFVDVVNSIVAVVFENIPDLHSFESNIRIINLVLIAIYVTELIMKVS